MNFQRVLIKGERLFFSMHNNISSHIIGIIEIFRKTAALLNLIFVNIRSQLQWKCIVSRWRKRQQVMENLLDTKNKNKKEVVNEEIDSRKRRSKFTVFSPVNLEFSFFFCSLLISWDMKKKSNNHHIHLFLA